MKTIQTYRSPLIRLPASARADAFTLTMPASATIVGARMGDRWSIGSHEVSVSIDAMVDLDDETSHPEKRTFIVVRSGEPLPTNRATDLVGHVGDNKLNGLFVFRLYDLYPPPGAPTHAPGEAPPPPPQVPDDFLSELGVEYRKPTRSGYATFPVLQFLEGRPWDQLALNAVHSLRPSQIRVTDGMVKDNAVTWRVTVFVNRTADGGKATIRRVEQEVEVCLYGCEHGADLSIRLKVPRR